MLQASVCRSITSCLVLCPLFVTVQPPSHAQITTFFTRSLFNSAYPSLLTEGFEAANTLPGALTPMFINVLDKDTNTAIFPTGSIIDGLRLSTVASGGGPGNDFDITGGSNSYASGDGTTAIVVDPSSASLDLTLYNNNVHQIGFDLGFNASGGAYTIQVFSGATLLSTDVLMGSVGSFHFLGYSAGPTITRVNVDAPLYETIDNVSIGTAASATPEPGSIVLIASLILAGFSFVSRFHKPVRNVYKWELLHRGQGNAMQPKEAMRK